MFDSRERNGETVYYLRDKRLEFSEKDKYTIRMDARGDGFYRRLLDGDVGLPRRLFYYIIDRAPEYAGPENSALFYHLLSIGHVPKKFSQFFRTYNTSTSSGEPKHVEQYVNYTADMIAMKEDLPSFGVNGNKEDFVNETKMEQFHENIERYFQMQHFMKSMNVINWSTPAI